MAEIKYGGWVRTEGLLIVRVNTVEPLLYDHPQNHIGVVV